VAFYNCSWGAAFVRSSIECVTLIVTRQEALLPHSVMRSFSPRPERFAAGFRGRRPRWWDPSPSLVRRSVSIRLKACRSPGRERLEKKKTNSANIWLLQTQTPVKYTNQQRSHNLKTLKKLHKNQQPHFRKILWKSRNHETVSKPTARWGCRTTGYTNTWK